MAQTKIKTKVRPVKKVRATAKCDWHTLVAGDLIKVIGGGPYWTTKDSVKISFGYRGYFKVKMLESDGIVAWGIRSGEAFSFIYMGEEKLSKVGTFLRKHHIRKVINNERKT